MLGGGNPAPSQPRNHEAQQLTYLQPFCTHTTMLFVQHSVVRLYLFVQYSVNHVRCSAVCYKLGLVLGDQTFQGRLGWTTIWVG